MILFFSLPIKWWSCEAIRFYYTEFWAHMFIFNTKESLYMILNVRIYTKMKKPCYKRANMFSTTKHFEAAMCYWSPSEGTCHSDRFPPLLTPLHTTIFFIDPPCFCLFLQVKYWTRTCATTSVCSFRRAHLTTSFSRSYGTTSTYAPSPVSTHIHRAAYQIACIIHWSSESLLCEKDLAKEEVMTQLPLSSKRTWVLLTVWSKKRKETLWGTLLHAVLLEYLL